MKRRNFLLLSGCTLSGCIDTGSSSIQIPVLGYHDIRISPDQYSISPLTFNQQMKWLYDNGYRTIKFSQFEQREYDDKSVIITFDDGYRSYGDTAVPIMMEYGFYSVVNVIGEYVGREMPDVDEARPMLGWDDYANLLDTGYVGMGCHTHSLHHPATDGVKGVPNEQLFTDLTQNRKEIRRKLSYNSTVLAWPYGTYNNESMKTAQAVGFTHALTSNFGYMNHFANRLEIPRIHLNRTTTIKAFTDAVSRSFRGEYHHQFG